MRHLNVPVRLAVLAIMGAALLVPATSEARHRDTVSNATGSYSSNSNCRGNKFQATEDVVIEDFSIWTAGTSGNSLDFFIYEGTSSGSSYEQLAHTDVAGSIAVGTPAFQSSGPMYVQATAGKWYVLVMCYSGGTSIAVYKDAGIAPSTVSWGNFNTGTYLSSGVPGATQTWGGNNFDIYMQIYTSAGGALWGGSPIPTTGSASNYVRGNAFDVTEDAYLWRVSQYAEVTTRGIGSYSAPWYIYRCSGTCASNASYTQVWTSTTTGIGGSGATFNTWISASPNIVLEAGYRYFIGIDITASGVGVNKFYPVTDSTPPDQDSEWGSMVSHGSISVSGAPANPANVGLSTTQRIVQRVAAFRLDQEVGTTTGTVAAGNTDKFGSVFMLTEPTQIRDFSLQMVAAYNGTIDVGVYESATPTGTYNRLWAGEMEVDSSTATPFMMDTGVINLDLDPDAVGGTGYYLIVGRFSGTGTSSQDLQVSFPQTVPFGTQVGSYVAVGSATLDSTLNVSSTQYKTDRKFGFEIRSRWAMVSSTPTMTATTPTPTSTPGSPRAA